MAHAHTDPQALRRVAEIPTMFAYPFRLVPRGEALWLVDDRGRDVGVIKDGGISTVGTTQSPDEGLVAMYLCMAALAGLGHADATPAMGE